MTNTYKIKMNLSLPHYYIPILCILIALVFQYSNLDISIAKNFYDPEHHLWPYQSSWLAQKILHVGARDVLALIYVSIIIFFIVTILQGKLKRYRRATGYVLLSSFTGIILIAILKDVTHLYTPWDLNIFNGQYPNIRLFDHVDDNLPVGHAFPSGHASGGFALVSIYYVAHYYKHPYSMHFLYAALTTGLILGVNQQIRGAHMMSHDLFTFSICWLSCIFWYRIILHGVNIDTKNY